jgi:hypothetical protein
MDRQQEDAILSALKAAIRRRDACAHGDGRRGAGLPYYDGYVNGIIAALRALAGEPDASRLIQQAGRAVRERQ